MNPRHSLHYLQHPLGEIWTGITIIDDEVLLIVVAGTKASPSQTIPPYLQENHLLAGQPTWVINTHCHCDHIGGNATLREVLGAELSAHRADSAWIQNHELQFQELFGPFHSYPNLAFDPVVFHHMAGSDVALSRVLEDGDRIFLGHREFTVLHLPGHSAGSIGLHESETGLLLTGDSLQGFGTVETQVPMLVDMRAYRRTLERPQEFDIRQVIAAHPFQPLSGAILDAEGSQVLIRHSLLVLDRYFTVTTSLFHDLGQRMSLLEISHVVAYQFEMSENNVYNMITTAACLEELISAVLIQRLSGHNWEPQGEFQAL